MNENSPDKNKPIEKQVENAFDFLKKDYTLVGKRHIRAWKAWLAIGLATVANRSGEVERGRAADTSLSDKAVRIELDMPSYLPDFLRHPNKFFSGRKIKLILPVKGTVNAVDFLEENGRIRSLPVKGGEEPGGLSFEIPVDTSSGNHSISFTLAGQLYRIPIRVYGLTEAERVQKIPSRLIDILQKLAIKYRTRICEGGCSWEMVFAGQPNNASNLAMSSADYSLHRSTDAGRTWAAENINALTTYPYPDMSYAADSKIILSSQGSLFLSALLQLFIGTTGELGGVLYKGGLTGGLVSSIFQDTPHDEIPTPSVFVDYPKLAVASESTLYIAGFTTRQSSDDPPHDAMYISSDGGKTFVSKRYRSDDVSKISSMTVGADGTLYAGDRNPDAGKIIRFKSFDPSLEYDIFSLPVGMLSMVPVRVSSESDHGWIVYLGPEIVADVGLASPHRGRLYAVWAKEESLIFDPNAEYGYYYYNTDVYASYSDNRGETWSAPVRVNDDTGKGDQMFPSARVDANGTLHVAFVDHRDNQDKAVFDVYYANTRDGVKFSKNLRITDAPTSNNPAGGRTIGDYLDMVAAYPDRTYVAYPCGQSEYGPTGACMVELDPRLVR